MSERPDLEAVERQLIQTGGSFTIDGVSVADLIAYARKLEGALR